MIAPYVESRSLERMAQEAQTAREMAELIDRVKELAARPIPTFEAELALVMEEMK